MLQVPSADGVAPPPRMPFCSLNPHAHLPSHCTLLATRAYVYRPSHINVRRQDNALLVSQDFAPRPSSFFLPSVFILPGSDDLLRLVERPTSPRVYRHADGCARIVRRLDWAGQTSRGASGAVLIRPRASLTHAGRRRAGRRRCSHLWLQAISGQARRCCADAMLVNREASAAVVKKGR